MSDDKREKGRHEQSEEKGRGQFGRLAVYLAKALGHEGHAQVARFYSNGSETLSEETIRKWSEGKVESLSDVSFKNVLGKLTESVSRRPYNRAVNRVGNHTVLRIHMEQRCDPSEIHKELFAALNTHNKENVEQKYLYYDPTGARRWLEVIGEDPYNQKHWVNGVEEFAHKWRNQPSARSMLETKHFEAISLGTGDGAKEECFLRCVRDLRAGEKKTTTCMLAEISISLLCSAAVRLGQFQHGQDGIDGFELVPWCADFEEGPMQFAQDLPSARTAPNKDHQRLVMILGNSFANVQHETHFVSGLKRTLIRPGDLLWLEVAEGCDTPTEDPLYDAMKAYPKSPKTNLQTMSSREALVVGSYLRHTGLGSSLADFPELQLCMAQTQEHCEVPDSYNFVYTVAPTPSAPRAIKMLYTRRYREPSLTKWFKERGFNTILSEKVASADERQRVLHLLLQRT